MNNQRIELSSFQNMNFDDLQEPYFRAAVERCIQAYRAQFSERLLAIYVWGSVYRNEAVAGFSDLDIYAFITDAYIDADVQWYETERKAIDAELPGLAALARPLPVSILSDGAKPDAEERTRAVSQAFGFRLCYDASCVWGRELVTRSSGSVPGKEFARASFQSVRDLARFEAGLDRQNKTDFQLPQEPTARLRKLARLGTLGAGYLLMARQQFRSFKGVEILPLLKGNLPEWEPFLSETERLYVAPQGIAPKDVTDYHAHLLLWLDWVNQHLTS